MSHGAALPLYTLLVRIWSSTWVAIEIGLADAPAYRPSAAPPPPERVAA